MPPGSQPTLQDMPPGGFGKKRKGKKKKKGKKGKKGRITRKNGRPRGFRVTKYRTSYSVF